MLKAFYIILFSGALVGLGNQLPKVSITFDDPNPTIDHDGVPVISDYKAPVVEGRPVEKFKFIKGHCQGLTAHNKTCARVLHASNADFQPIKTPRLY